MPRIIPCLSALALLCLPCATAWAQDAPHHINQDERIDKVIGRLWWNNDERFSDLGLTPEVRVQMDQIARDFLADSSMSARVDLQQEIAGALARGDWQVVEAKGEALAQAVAEPVRSQVQLKIEVFQLLTPTQRTMLHEGFPRLLGRTWLRMAVGPRPRVGGDGPRRSN